MKGVQEPLMAKGLVVGADSCLDVAIISDSNLGGIGLPEIEYDRFSELLKSLKGSQSYLDEPEVDHPFPHRRVCEVHRAGKLYE